MSTTIDSLDIQISSSAGNSAANIERLADALGKLKANSKLTATVNNLTKLKTALDGLKDVSSGLQNVERIGNSLSKLQGIGKLTGLASAVNTLKKIPDVMAAMNTAALDEFTLKMNKLATALAPLSTQLNAVGTAFGKLPTKIQQIVTGTNRMAAATEKAAAAQGKHRVALNATRINLAALITNVQTYVGVIQSAVQMISKFMADAIEWDGIQFRFGRAFGEDADEVYAYIEKINGALDINIQQFMQYSSLYGSLLSGFGMAQKQVTTISVGLTELSYDIWAAYNDRYKTLEDASEAVRSAITGEIEPIRNAGIALTEASMQEYLDSLGMAEVRMANLTEAQKAEVRYAVMVNSAMNQGIIGTYARETETAEGAVRTLTQQLKTLAQAFGGLFIPILKVVVPWVSAFVELLTEAVHWVAALFGVELQKITWGDSMSSGAGGMADLAENADTAGGAIGDAAKEAKKLKSYTMGFDELNVINPNTGSSGASGAGGAGVGGAGGGSLGLDLDTLWDDSIFADAKNKVDEIKASILGFFDSWIGKAALVGGAIASLIPTFLKIRNILKLIKGTKFATTIAAAFGALKGSSAAKSALTFMFPKASAILASATGWVKGTLAPVLGRALASVGTALAAIPGWVIALIAAIAGTIILGFVDYDFTEVGRKLGKALGKAFSKIKDWFGGAWEWAKNVGTSIKDGLVKAWDWVADTFDIHTAWDIVGLFNPVVWITKIVPKMIEVGKEVLPGIWEGIVSWWDNLKGNISEFIDGFVDGWKEGLGIASPSKVFAEIGRFIIEGLLGGLTEKWEAIKTWFNTTVAPKLTLDYWKKKTDTIKQGVAEKLEETKKKIDEKWKGLKSWFSGNVAPILTKQYWMDKWDGVKQGVSEKLDEVKQKISDKWDAVKQWYQTNVAPKFTKEFWVEKFEGLKTGFTTTIKGMINTGIEYMNKFIGWLNSKMHFSWEAFEIAGKQIIPAGTIQLFTIPKIPTLADGGFVNAGQMFIAREAGPELVGSINGRTAVANNDQIVAAVSKGVYDAVVAAMSASNNSSGEQSFNFYLDGKQIYADVKKRESERGRTLMGNQLGYSY